MGTIYKPSLWYQDKSYLMKALLAEGSQVKPQKVKRVPGSSGRLHKTADGEWEWSDEEMDKDSVEARNIMNSERVSGHGPSCSSLKANL